MMLWEKKELDSQLVKEIAERFGITVLEAAVFTRREITSPEDISYFLETDPRLLHNPFLFNDMERVVDRIRAAVERGESIAVFGDRDVDGVTSTVLLVETLRDMGARVTWDLPQGEEEYGLTTAVVKRIRADGADLLITVDCGVTNNAEIEIARDMGMETLVIDHHNPQGDLPSAVGIIDPKVAESGYPFRDLSGCGVVSKVDWALQVARTPHYRKEMCLLNVRPANQAYMVDVVKVRNLAEIDRIMEEIVPGMVSFGKTRLKGFLGDAEVAVLDADLHKRLLERSSGSALSSCATSDRSCEMCFRSWRARVC